MKKEEKSKNNRKSKKKISILTVFLLFFLVATMITILTRSIKNTKAIESENKSEVVKSAFEDASNLDLGDTCTGIIKLNGEAIEDKGVINVWPSGMWDGSVDATKYEIKSITNSNSNVATVVSPTIDSWINNKELAVEFETGTEQGTTEIIIKLNVFYPHYSLGTWNMEIYLKYIVTNETIYANEEIDPSDLSIEKEAEKDKERLGNDVSFNITVTNNSDRKISHLKVIDYCENCEDVILTAPLNINGTLENFSLDAGETITFKATIEEVQEKHLVDGSKIVNHAYLYIEDGTEIGEDKAEVIVEVPIVYSAYKIKHEYYKKDKDNNSILEDTVLSDVIDDVIVGTKVGISDENEVVDIEVEKILEHTIDGVEYTYEYLENSGNVIIEENTVKEITIKYVREEKEKIPEKVVIKVEKIWEDNENEKGKRPENVILQVKNKDKIVEEVLVDERNNWSYEFLLPKYDEKGEEIEYRVDEKETSKYYEKVIDGYRVINKYIEKDEENINDNKNDVIESENNANTSDINIWLYIGIFVMAIVVIVIVIIFIKRKPN